MKKFATPQSQTNAYSIPLLLRRYLKNKRGSLLIESLLSTVILSVSLTLIIQSLTSSLRSVVYSAEYTNAVMLLENKMFEIVKQGFIQKDLRQEEQLPEPNERYKISLETGNAASGNIPSSMNEVKLSIAWNSGRRTNNISLVTYLFDLSNEKNQ